MKKLEESNLQLHLEKLKVDPSVDMSKENTSVSRKYFRHTSSIEYVHGGHVGGVKQ